MQTEYCQNVDRNLNTSTLATLQQLINNENRFVSSYKTMADKVRESGEMEDVRMVFQA
jgi:hypothetical protein